MRPARECQVHGLGAWLVEPTGSTASLFGRGTWRPARSLAVCPTLASHPVTWVTFVPCFVFTFLGALYVERLRNNQHPGAAPTEITASVVGVIADGLAVTLTG